VTDAASQDAGIRYLDAAAVAACLPPLPRLLALAELALRAVVAGGDVPPKAAVGDASGRFAHAMPARLDAARVPGGGASTDLLGMKWIAGAPGNRAAGLPAMAALIVLSDPVSGRPMAIMEGGGITAWRTAALSGVAIGLLAVPQRPAARAVILGAGAQGAAHAAVLGSVLPGVRLAIHDRHSERAADLAARATGMAGIAAAAPVTDLRAALLEADVIVSATSLGGTPDLVSADVAPDALVLPVDYAARVGASLVLAATTFAVDDREQLARNRRNGRLEGWPDATAVMGELLLTPRARLPGIAVALHQGPAIADLVVADAVLATARSAGIGVLLAR